MTAWATRDDNAFRERAERARFNARSGIRPGANRGHAAAGEATSERNGDPGPRAGST